MARNVCTTPALLIAGTRINGSIFESELILPLTFFAHQSVVLPLKIKRPQRFDATALCVGAMAPDLAYPVSLWLGLRSHRLNGMLIWAIPFTLVACWAVRRWVASTAFAHLPDFGPIRTHSLRAIRHRLPGFKVTLLSATIGAGSHILLDSFTHADRFMSKTLGLDRVLFNMPVRGPMTIARTLQFLGHTVGSVIGLAMMAFIGSRFLIEEWYGHDVVEGERSFTLRLRQRLLFWSIVAVGPIVGAIWSSVMDCSVPFSIIDATGLAVFVAAAIPACQPLASAPTGR